MASGMWWKGLVIALLVLPPIAYVAGSLSSRVDAPEQRPALVLDDNPPAPARTERQVTVTPRPQPSPPAAVGDGRGADQDDDDREDAGDRGAGGVTIVRPSPQEAADQSDGSGDDDDSDDDDDSRDDDDGGDDDGDDD